MAKSLIIVESPSKARTIQKYLGSEFVVKSSVGHVKDLPKDALGIDLDADFAPTYVTIHGKGKVLQEIRSAAKTAKNVYLATDPDREGEAIAWHIASELGEREGLFRVRFNEITKRAILEGIDHPTRIDLDMVNAQQARRVLDRIVGYKLSPLLWEKVQRGLSAGRVQSVAVRLVAEREAEVKAFVPEEWWSVTAKFPGPPAFEARLTHLDGEQVKIGEGETAHTVTAEVTGQPFTVAKVTRRQRQRKPVAPFITSKLQQDAARKLGFTPKRTMSVAQQLYEGVELGSEGPVGLITYMRTDSTRVAEDALGAARDFITGRYGAEYLPEKAIHYRSKASAQDAHEAIRPTDVSRAPEAVQSVLSREQYKLYRLIWERFVACQMVPAKFDETVAEIKNGRATFRANGQVMTFPGFTAVYTEGRDEKAEDEGALPALAEGQTLEATGVEPKQHFTQPPPRYNEALLIKELEEREIGRPSTYATIISTIQERKYVDKREGRFHITDLGAVVNELLVAHFDHVVNAEFTARMERELDEVEEGKKPWVASVRDFYDPFTKDLDAAQKNMRNIKREAVPTDIVCDQCGKTMVIRWGKHGRFLACSAYPECRNTKEFREEGGRIEIVEGEVTDTPCPACGKPMAIKTGKFGRFLACSGYPECKTTRPVPTGVGCPREGCGGVLIEKQSRRGKVFFSCSNYPKCEYASWDRPVPEPCPSCGHPFLVAKGSGLACPNKGCGYKRKAA